MLCRVCEISGGMVCRWHFLLPLQRFHEILQTTVFAAMQTTSSCIHSCRLPYGGRKPIDVSFKGLSYPVLASGNNRSCIPALVV